MSLIFVENIFFCIFFYRKGNSFLAVCNRISHVACACVADLPHILSKKKVIFVQFRKRKKISNKAGCTV